MFATIWLIVVIALAISAWIGFRITSKRKSPEKPSLPAWSRWIFLGFAIVISCAAVLTVINSLTYRLDPGESAVIKSWTGQVNEQAVYSENGGIHAKAPWDEVTAFNVRNQQIVFQPQGGNDVNITASTKDNASVYIDATLTYNQDPQSVVGIYKMYHTEAELRTQLIRDARGALQNAPTKFVTMEIKQSRPQLEQAFTADLREKLEKKYNIELTSVSIRNMWFTDEVQKSLDAVQQRNAEVEQARAQLNTAMIKAEVTKTDAQAQADADQIMRCGATSEAITEMVNGKETKSIKVIPLPNEKCQNRLNEQILTKTYIEALKEIASKSGNVIITDGKTLPMVQLPAATK